MLSFVIAFVASVLVTCIIGLPLGNIWYGVIPGIIAAGVVWFLIGRRVMQDLQQRMAVVQKILTPANPMRPTKPRIDDAVAVLEDGYKWSRWSPFVEGQLAGQVGTLYFIDKRFEAAQPHLEKSSARNWVAKAMLGVIWYKRKNEEEMKKAFESAVKYSGKESLLWNLYAYCLYKRDRRDEAIAVLNRGIEKMGDEARTAKNLQNIQNSKGMKMRGWNEMWYQFHLEKPPQVSPIQQRHSGRGNRGR